MIAAKQVLFELGEVHKELIALLYEFLEAFELYLEREEEVSGKTIHNYERILTRFFRFIQNKTNTKYWVIPHE